MFVQDIVLEFYQTENDAVCFWNLHSEINHQDLESLLFYVAVTLGVIRIIVKNSSA